MNGFWQERTSRERALLMVAGGLCLLVALYQFGWMPLADYRARAAARLAAADRLYVDVAQGARLVAAARQDDQKADARPLRLLASANARDMGLAITRLQPSGEEELSIWFDHVDSRLLWRWLVALQRDHGVSVIKATIQRDDDQPTVRAQFLLHKPEKAT